MGASHKTGREAWSDFGAGVLAWILGAVMLGGGMWLFFGAPDLGKLFGGSDSTSGGFNPRPVQQYVDEGYEPSDQEIEQAQRDSWEKVTGQKWSCFYDPTMNDDWHDDVLCTDGPSSHRPTLLADYTFITEDDARAAGQEYEDYLNSGGRP